MDIIREITGFFERLFRQKVNTAKSQANAKVRGAQVRAQSKAANAVNQKIKAGTQKVTEGAKAKVAKKGDDAKK